jgi:hypothetical protein
LRGGSLHKRGLSKEQICVMTGVADSGTAFAVLSGRGVISKRRTVESLAGRVGHGAIVMADGSLSRCDGSAGSHI